jgi:hypothetical protein
MGVDKTRWTIYMVLSLSMLLFIVLTVFLYKNSSGQYGVTSDVCNIHRTFYEDKIDSGIVTQHFVDTADHASKKLTIQKRDKIYNLLFIPYDNWEDFEKIKTGDIVSKQSSTFAFRVNDNHEFKLKYDCYSNYKGK